ncbi:MAG: TetR family transcriptional regulator [Ornithinimicrobium sp.]|uniref:TetR/AcrR family transcriptional regulator n=1 Tax=Ornithinimicrobium sp. TaxID=1977084 RepID=UPI0026DEA19D|nr:TetR/AcrR family transcriptional regulator [Ornithinimicrobium sp.]MDO5738581.1 TetR family transcriptional regulator [Ornithinimicrobium sp.]
MTGQAAGSHDRVLQVARRLFGECGYAAVTIREVAAQAGVSPAMVMKIAGSKEQLYGLATPAEPAPLLADTPIEGLGELLVRRMLERRDQDAAEPWLRAMYLRADAPDQEVALAEFRERFLGRFPHEGEDARHTDQLACLMLGLAAGVRSFRLLGADRASQEAVVREYGELVQRVLDRLTGQTPQHPLPQGDGRGEGTGEARRVGS